MTQYKDYYQVLGLDKKATPEEIKRAYRKLAREHHPDMVQKEDKTQAEKRFKEINEAYQVLSDPQKKQMYDQYGHAGTGFPGGGAGSGFGDTGPFTYSYSSGSGQGGFDFGGDFDPFDVFESIFGFRGFGGARRPRKGKNLYYELHLSLQDAIFGIKREINIESGKVKIKVPAGIRDGMEMRFPGKGMPGPENVPAGDLFLTFRVRHKENFRIMGSDVVMAREIDFIQAVLGDAIEVPVIDLDAKMGLGKAKLKIPQGTQPGTRFVLKGKGMPRVNRSSRGNVLVQVSVKIPKRLSRKQRKILEQYKNL